MQRIRLRPTGEKFQEHLHASPLPICGIFFSWQMSLAAWCNLCILMFRILEQIGPSLKSLYDLQRQPSQVSGWCGVILPTRQRGDAFCSSHTCWYCRNTRCRMGYSEKKAKHRKTESKNAKGCYESIQEETVEFSIPTESRSISPNSTIGSMRRITPS